MLIRAQACGLSERGFDVVVFNPRGNAIPQITTHLFDYSKTVLDLDEVMRFLFASYPSRSVYLVGTSLGASLGVKYLARFNEDQRVKGMVSIANPFDVYQAAANANSWRNHVYGSHLTKNLIQKVMFNRKAIERWSQEHGRHVEFDRLKRLKSTFAFDKEVTFRMLHQYDNSKDYYKLFSCTDDVAAVRQPVLFLQSKNDPISRWADQSRSDSL